MTTTKEPVLGELDALIVEGQDLNASYESAEVARCTLLISDRSDHEFHTFATVARATIARLAGEESIYYRQLPTAMPECMSRMRLVDSVVPVIIGALAALRRAVAGGFLTSLENRLRANVYDDFLVQADELLKANYHVAAMVLIGGVLEDHMKKLCVARSLAWTGKGSMSAYNDLLRDHATAYDTSAWRRIQSIGDDRNKAGPRRWCQRQARRRSRPSKVRPPFSDGPPGVRYQQIAMMARGPRFLNQSCDCFGRLP